MNIDVWQIGLSALVVVASGGAYMITLASKMGSARREFDDLARRHAELATETRSRVSEHASQLLAHEKTLAEMRSDLKHLTSTTDRILGILENRRGHE
jgi:hypothetical protein